MPQGRARARRCGVIDQCDSPLCAGERRAIIPDCDPGRDRRADRGGLITVGEMLDDDARRELRSSAGLREAYLEQLFTFGDPLRHTRAHVVSVAYMALSPEAATVGRPSTN